MLRNELEKQEASNDENEKNSTNQILTRLGIFANSRSNIKNPLRVGGPPAKPPTILASCVQLSEDVEEKKDEDGLPYIGISIKELIKLQTEEKNAVSSNKVLSEDENALKEKGIYKLM